MRRIAFVLIAALTLALTNSGCKRACKDVTCFNGGDCNSSGMCNCVNRWGGLNCEEFCPLGYEGSFCNQLSRRNVIRTWNATTTSPNTGTVQHPLYITEGTTAEKIIINNFNNEGYTMIGYFSGKGKFDIVSQNATGSFTGIVDGAGNLNGDKLTIDLTKEGINYFASCNK